MAFRKVEAGNGVNWLRDAVQLITKNPVPFLVMGLILAVAVMIPLLGGLAIAILGPALYAGIMFAAREERNGRRAEIMHLFRGFQAEGKLPKLLILCLPGIAAGIVLAIIGVILLGGAMIGAGMSAGEFGESGGALAAGALGGSMLLFLLLALVIGFFAFALVMFAMPRVMFDGREAFDAMKESLRATLANIVPVIVFGIIVLLGAIVVTAILSFISAALAQLVVGTAIYPLVSVTIYYAWRDVFAGSAESVAAAPPPPAPPPAEPPASPPPSQPAP